MTSRHHDRGEPARLKTVPVRLWRSAIGVAALAAVMTTAAAAPVPHTDHRPFSPVDAVTSQVGSVLSAQVASGENPPAEGERAEVVRLVNKLRIAAGCPALAPYPALTEAAQDHSASMARTGRLSHRGPGGRSLVQRLEDVGYVWSQVGENIAYGYPDAAAVVAGWMDSPPHRRNILACGHRDIGVGLAHGHDTTWWTQITGAQR
jgi:uncharacterized protein YkwD